MKMPKLLRGILFPPTWLCWLLLPLGGGAMGASMLLAGPESLYTVPWYVLAAYTLTVWCFRIPHIIGFWQAFKRGNRYILRWQADPRLRVRISLWFSLGINLAYAVLQLGLGFTHRSFWFFSLAGYYLSLAAMRIFLARYMGKNLPGENPCLEWKKYRACGVVFLVMNLAISLMIFFMVYWGRTFRHHEITAITLAAYTFTAMTLAIVNLVRYRKYQSPVFTASKCISLAAACVSMLTLTTTLLTVFDRGEMDLFGKKLLLGLTGGAVSLVILTMAVFMIVQSVQKLKKGGLSK